ncbi:Chondroitin sulfate proteoglycan 4 [Saguinus oedipus]|uniref:Chondroitin sulfate proteoglycan 4 n=1 Tax=Saguinus oedipus TaxID=9490 RepID=A0ABQ9V2G6_SAGOE|nr:Chondroitin sulfate proteoglycan 4 [Saguinus oedipus]
MQAGTFTGPCPQMWEGAAAPIPAEALRGTDGDSRPEDLVYTIEQPSNGRVVLWAAPGTEVRSFTQAQLDGGLGRDPGSCCPRGSPEHPSSGHFFRVAAQKQLLLSLEGSRTLTVCPAFLVAGSQGGAEGRTPG